MRKEIELWLRQSEHDLTAAENACRSGDFFAAAFWSQQATEKGLKAVCLLKHLDVLQGHSLMFLAKNAGFPQPLFGHIRRLNPQYMITRYPDVAQGVPADLLDKEDADACIASAKEVTRWCQSQIKK